MKRFIDTIKNIFSIEELRTRILNTLLFITVFRLGSHVVLPGVEPDKMNISSSGLLGLLDTFLGGAFSNASIFALGIMPYISASIAIQLLTMALPYFQKMQKEGESGRKKLNQITRVLTIIVTLAQGLTYLNTTIPDEALLVDRGIFTVSSIFIITSGTMFCMWLGERITDKGVGNGISMLIMIGIVSRFPAAIIQEFNTRGSGGILIFVLELVALYFVIMAAVMLTQAVRKIPIQYAKQVVGNKVMGGQRQYLPLKVNAAGVMPIIFAQALMFIPSTVAQLFAEKSDAAANIATTFANYTSWQYNVLLASLIIVFYVLLHRDFCEPTADFGRHEARWRIYPRCEAWSSDFRVYRRCFGSYYLPWRYHAFACGNFSCDSRYAWDGFFLCSVFWRNIPADHGRCCFGYLAANRELSSDASL